jgi:hypothetical protein
MPWLRCLVACAGLGQSMGDLTMDKVTKSHWNKFLYEPFGFTLSVSVHQGSMLIYHLQDEEQALGGCSSETQSHPINMKNMRAWNIKQSFVSSFLIKCTLYHVYSDCTCMISV